MSGEAVLEETFYSALDAGVRFTFDYYGFTGAPLASMILSQGVRNLGIRILDLLDQRAENARDSLAWEERRRRWEELAPVQDRLWDDFIALRNRIRLQVERYGAAPLFDLPAPSPLEDAPCSQEKGFLNIHQQRELLERIERELTELAAALADLPREIRALNPKAFRQLDGYCSRMQRRLLQPPPPALREIETLRQTYTRTLADTLAKMERQLPAEKNPRNFYNALFLRSLFMMRLSAGTPLQQEWDDFNLQLLEHATTAQSPASLPANTPDALENRFNQLAEKTRQTLIRSAAAELLAHALAEELETLGYPLKEKNTTNRRFTFRTPGGEFLRAAIDPRLHLSFQVVRRLLPGEESPDEYALRHYRSQEERFGEDLRQLIPRFRRRGLDFHIRLERSPSDRQIPAVVDDARENDAGTPPDTESTARSLTHD